MCIGQGAIVRMFSRGLQVRIPAVMFVCKVGYIYFSQFSFQSRHLPFSLCIRKDLGTRRQSVICHLSREGAALSNKQQF